MQASKDVGRNIEYTNQKKLSHLEFVEDAVSGQNKWRDLGVWQRFAHFTTTSILNPLQAEFGI